MTPCLQYQGVADKLGEECADAMKTDLALVTPCPQYEEAIEKYGQESAEALERRHEYGVGLSKLGLLDDAQHHIEEVLRIRKSESEHACPGNCDARHQAYR